MKFRNMFLKYYAEHDDGSQGGGDGGAAAYEAQQGQQGDNADDNPDTDPDEKDPGNADTDPDEQDLDENGEPKTKEGENGEDDDQEEEFLFDGKAVTVEPTDEDDQEGDTELVKRLRAQLREQKKQIKGSTQKKDPQEIPADMPRKPEMGDEGIDWDPEKYAEALDKWTEDKAAFQQHQAAQEAKREAFGKKFQEGQTRYQTERAKAIKKYAGFEKAEAAIAELPEPLQAGLMITSQNPTALVMALGRNADLRKQVEDAYNNDHIALGYLIRDIESRAGSAPKARQQLNKTPDVKGQNGVANVGQLEALRKKAEETGDYTAYFAAKEKREKK